MLVVMVICFVLNLLPNVWFYQLAVHLLGHWPCVFQHLRGISAVNN